MAAPLTQSRVIDNLPAPLRKEAIDMMLKGVSTRKISEFLAKHGYKLGFCAIARYKKNDLAEHLKTAAKLQAVEQLTPENGKTVSTIAEATASVVAAKPLLARIGWMWSEVENGVEETRSGWVEDAETGARAFRPADVKARASLLNVGAKLVDVEGKALGLAGFGGQQQAQAGPTIQIAIINNHAAPAEPERAPIDLDAYEVE